MHAAFISESAAMQQEGLAAHQLLVVELANHLLRRNRDRFHSHMLLPSCSGDVRGKLTFSVA